MTTSQNNIKPQYEIFKRTKEDLKIEILNKASLENVLQELEHCGLLMHNESINNYDISSSAFGAQCTVHKATRKTDKKIKALKVTPFFLCQELHLVGQVRAMMTIQHENVIKPESVFFTADPQSMGFGMNIVMPWIGCTFFQWLIGADLKGSLANCNEAILKSKRGFQELRKLLIEVLRGLEAIHKARIVHMTLNFNHVLVDTEHSGKAKIIGFGGCQSLDKLTGQITFVQGFVAPEIQTYMVKELGISSTKTKDDLEALQRACITPQVDIFALGVMLFMLFVGKTDEIGLLDLTKVNSENISERITKCFTKCDKDTPQEEMIVDIVQIIEGCLELDPLKRLTIPELFQNHKFFQ